MDAYLYPLALLGISVLVFILERLFPWREQRALRPALLSDFVHLVFNGHFLGLILYGIANKHLLAHIDGLLPLRNVAAGWPLFIQIAVALVVTDFIHWCVHNLLHRVRPLWQTHKVHHSVVDGEMDWIVSFRFQWTEVVVYRVVQYLPLAFFGFSHTAVMVHAIFGTLIGHLNHANLRWDYGPLRYILNNPRMHIWHHNYDADEKSTVNFGIIFSVWDWLFGTAYLPDEPPEKIGFSGVESFPGQFFAQAVWPLQRWVPSVRPNGVFATMLGVVLVAVGIALSR